MAGCWDQKAMAQTPIDRSLILLNSRTCLFTLLCSVSVPLTMITSITGVNVSTTSVCVIGTSILLMLVAVQLRNGKRKKGPPPSVSSDSAGPRFDPVPTDGIQHDTAVLHAIRCETRTDIRVLRRHKVSTFSSNSGAFLVYIGGEVYSWRTYIGGGGIPGVYWGRGVFLSYIGAGCILAYIRGGVYSWRILGREHSVMLLFSQ